MTFSTSRIHDIVYVFVFRVTVRIASPILLLAVDADVVQDGHLPQSAVMRMKRRLQTNAGGGIDSSGHLLIASALMTYDCAFRLKVQVVYVYSDISWNEVCMSSRETRQESSSC